MARSPASAGPSTVANVIDSIRSSQALIDVRQLGTVDYRVAWQQQRDLADARVAGGSDTLLLLEHPPVYTAGRRTEPHERPVDGTPVVDTDRGGKITWHGPGQLVGYPIIGLAEPLDVVNYVRRLEEALIKVCADLGLDAVRVAGPVRGVGAGRRRPARPQGRRHRRPGVAGDHPARVRAQLRLRPGRVQRHRAVRHQRRRSDVADRPNCGRPVSVDDVRRAVADAVCDALDGVLPVREHPAARVASRCDCRAAKAASCCAWKCATPRPRSSANRRGSGCGPGWGRSTPSSRAWSGARGCTRSARRPAAPTSSNAGRTARPPS